MALNFSAFSKKVASQPFLCTFIWGLRFRWELAENRDTMRAELIGHSKACMTEIYLHIDARMADNIRTHPYGGAGAGAEWIEYPTDFAGVSRHCSRPRHARALC